MAYLPSARHPSRVGADVRRRLAGASGALLCALPSTASATEDAARGELYTGFLGHALALTPSFGFGAQGPLPALELSWGPVVRTFRPVLALASIGLLVEPDRARGVQLCAVVGPLGGGAGFDADGPLFSALIALPPPLLTLVSWDGAVGVAASPRLRWTFRGDGRDEPIAELGLSVWLDLGAIAAEPLDGPPPR